MRSLNTYLPEEYSELYQTSYMEFFAKMVNGFQMFDRIVNVFS